MGKFSNHIGDGEKVLIDKEEFILKPLGVEYSGHFLKIGKGFSGAKEEGDTEGMFKNFTDETMDCIKEVVVETLKVSYPGEPEDELKLFAGKYLMKLLPAIVKMNGSGSMDEGDTGRAKKKLEALKRLRAKKDGCPSTDSK